MTPKPAACFLSAKGDLMSKMLHEYVFDMQLSKKSEGVLTIWPVYAYTLAAQNTDI